MYFSIKILLSSHCSLRMCLQFGSFPSCQELHAEKNGAIQTHTSDVWLSASYAHINSVYSDTSL